MQEVYWVEEGVLGGRCGPDCVPWVPEDLHAGGVRGIISLDSYAVNPQALTSAGIVHLPLYQPMILLESTAERQKFLEVVPHVLRFVHERGDQGGVPAIVHCHYGRDRTGCVLSCCLVARHGWSAERAIAHVRSFQPLALSAPGYAEAVELFECLSRKGQVAE
jgi:hypothetical protein